MEKPTQDQIVRYVKAGGRICMDLVVYSILQAICPRSKFFALNVARFIGIMAIENVLCDEIQKEVNQTIDVYANAIQEVISVNETVVE